MPEADIPAEQGGGLWKWKGGADAEKSRSSQWIYINI